MTEIKEVCSLHTNFSRRLQKLGRAPAPNGRREHPLLPAGILMSSIAIGLTAAFIVFVPAGKVKCITEGIRTAAMSVSRYHLTEDNSAEGLRISDRRGGGLAGEFAFVAEVSGLYRACFWSPTFQISTAVSVDFQWARGLSLRHGLGSQTMGSLRYGTALSNNLKFTPSLFFL
ncbi:hypothetical protein IEQ34_002161 [Dendrobium chrysotoxum]|uniref:Uncharacterized protein n=1 Tax=Dendrobium chrysotoxum TaxID=161865 RepID=A0AAV7H560_DENCH|nr:hypothetical protein IEQ34_002161 [Dendrobium chrysotoxum]